MKNIYTVYICKLRQNYFPFEHLSAPVYRRDGKRKKRNYRSKQQKTKNQQKPNKGGNYGVYPQIDKQNYAIPVSEELLAEMKKMRPQDLMNTLINPEEQNYRSFLLTEGQDYQLIDLIEEEKKIRPHDLMNTLIDDPEIAYNSPEGARESVQSCKCPRQYFGWGEMKKMNQIELMEKLLEINKCQGCH